MLASTGAGWLGRPPLAWSAPRLPWPSARTAVAVAAPVFQPQTYLDSSRMDPFLTSQLTITPAVAPIYNRYFINIMSVFEPLHQEREEYNSWLVPLTLKDMSLVLPRN